MDLDVTEAVKTIHEFFLSKVFLYSLSFTMVIYNLFLNIQTTNNLSI